MLRETIRASFALSPRSVRTWVAQFRGTRTRTNSPVLAMVPSLPQTELASAGPRCAGWIRWKRQFGMGNCWCGSNISGNWSRIRIEIKGWHTLRHSYTTLLRQNNNNPKVVQGLLRHASYSITMNVYDEAMSEEKRNAHRGVIQQLNRSVTRSAPKPAIPQVVEKVGVLPVTPLTLVQVSCGELF
jgi:hypothetical protein